MTPGVNSFLSKIVLQNSPFSKNPNLPRIHLGKRSNDLFYKLCPNCHFEIEPLNNNACSKTDTACNGTVPSNSAPAVPKNCVFNNCNQLPVNWSIGRLDLTSFVTKHISAGCINYPKKLKQFLSLTKCILFFLFKEKMPQKVLDEMSPLERKLMMLFIRKKKVYNFPNAEITCEYFEQVRAHKQCKRIEENLKFVFKKAAHFMQSVFRQCLYPRISGLLNPRMQRKAAADRVEYAFYGYYFGDIAPKINQKIEKFFHPRSSENERRRFGKLIPKTVSRLYINYLKMSPKYTKDMKSFLTECLVLEVRSGIFNKVSRMCITWQNYLSKFGEEKLLEMVTDNFENNSKCKIAWSIQEVEGAIVQINQLLDKI